VPVAAVLVDVPLELELPQPVTMKAVAVRADTAARLKILDLNFIRSP
jgi:hypothetical protein